MAMIQVTIGNNLSRKNVLVDGDNKTLRQAFEENDINYASGIVSLDGASLTPGMMDKTFAENGVTGDRCYLMVSVKADNAVSAHIAGSALVVTSTATPDELASLAKYRPDALVLTEGEGSEKREVFKVCTGNGAGSIGAFGAVFSSVTNNDGKATITMQIPADVKDRKEWAEEHIGLAILKLANVEGQFADALASVAEEKALVSAAITAE